MPQPNSHRRRRDLAARPTNAAWRALVASARLAKSGKLVQAERAARLAEAQARAAKQLADFDAAMLSLKMQALDVAREVEKAAVIREIERRVRAAQSGALPPGFRFSDPKYAGPEDEC